MTKKPVIRFKNYNEDWEQRKLGEIVGKIESGNRLPKEKIVQGNIPYIVAQSTNNGVFKYIDKNSKDYHGNNMKLFPGNSITFSIDNPHAIFYQEQPFYTSNIMRVIHKEELKREQYIFILESMKKFTHSYDWSRKFSGPVVSNLPLRFPSYKEEQVKIGTFFKQLDDTIALHQRQLEALEKTKKSFLQKMFPKKDETKPEIRFAGFTDDWEQRKLGEISNKVQEKNRNREYTETLTNSAEFGIISQNEFFDKEISNKKNLDGYYIVKPDDFVYNPRISNHAPVGPIKRNRLGRTGVMSPLYYVFKPSDIDETYLEKYFDTTYWHRFMKLNGDSGARADRFAIKDSIFKEMPIPYPIIKEQEKIGTFFDYLDETIALHQRQLEALEKMKKSFLQKMFI